MRFSIITCTYNSERYLQKNIDSVKNQSFQDFEHIFIDGFSSDKTMEIIKKYQQQFPEKVKCFQFEPNGISNAMNRGIEKSSGKYINHLHSDDSFYSNDVLEKISKFIQNNNDLDLIYGKANFFNPNSKNHKIIPHRKIYQKIRFWLLLLTNYIPHQAVFIKKEIFEKFGMFDEQYKNSMDYELWLRFSKNKIKHLFIDEIICNFSTRNDSISSTGKNNSVEENKIIIRRYAKSKLFQLLLNLVMKINSKRNFFK